MAPCSTSRSGRSRTALRALALAPAVALVLAACGGGDDDAADEPDDAPTTTEAAVDLTPALLTAEDLASDDPLDTGWAEGDVAEGVDIQLPECVTEEPGAGAVASAERKLVTQNDLKLPFVEQDLAAYEDGGAEAAFDAAAERLDACTPEFVFQGTPATGTIARLPLELGGDPSAAWRTTVEIAGTQVAITNIHVVDGDQVLTLTHVDAGTPDPGVLQELAATALAKL